MADPFDLGTFTDDWHAFCRAALARNQKPGELFHEIWLAWRADQEIEEYLTGIFDYVTDAAEPDVRPGQRWLDPTRTMVIIDKVLPTGVVCFHMSGGALSGSAHRSQFTAAHGWKQLTRWNGPGLKRGLSRDWQRLAHAIHAAPRGESPATTELRRQANLPQWGQEWTCTIDGTIWRIDDVIGEVVLLIAVKPARYARGWQQLADFAPEAGLWVRHESPLQRYVVAVGQWWRRLDGTDWQVIEVADGVATMATRSEAAPRDEAVADLCRGAKWSPTAPPA